MATSKPTKLTLTRNGEKITAKWDIPKGGYDSQVAKRYPYNGENKWHEVSVTKSTKSKAITFDRSNWFPYKSSGAYKKKVDEIKFKVAGTKNKKESDFTTASFDVKVPNDATMSRTNVDNVTTTFKWSVKTDKTAHKIYTRALITTVLVNNGEDDETKVDWDASYSYTTKIAGSTQSTTRKQWWTDEDVTSGTITIVENASLVGTGSWTRWVKVRPAGPAGWSEKAVVKKFTYGAPESVTADNMESDAVAKAGGMTVTVDYASQVTATHPVDNYVISWMIATPDAGMQCPTWSSGGSYEIPNIGNDGSGKYQFDISQKPSADECLWTRVDAVHATRTTIGEPQLVLWYNGKAGYLTAPTSLSVTAGTTSSTISCTNASSVPDSYIVVRFYDDDHTNGVDVASFAVGTTSGTVTHPEVSGTAKFGVYAAVASSGVTSSVTIDDENLLKQTGTLSTYLEDIYENGASYTLDYAANVINYVSVFIVPSVLEYSDLYTHEREDRNFTGYSVSTSSGVTTLTINAGESIFNPYMIEDSSTLLACSGTIYIYVGYSVDQTASTSTTVNCAMVSAVTVQGGSIPTAPTGFAISKTDTSGMVRAEWDWSWDDATHAELSWADHPDAWMSTAEPDTYTVARLYDPTWLIADLETGKPWYFRIRFLQVNDSTTTYGGYAEQKTCDLRTNPNLPLITSIEPKSIAEEGSVTVVWTYSSDDQTAQKSATVYESLGAGAYNALATVGSAQYVTIDNVINDDGDVRWENGTTHDLVVQVTSEGGLTSGYSEPVTLVVAEPPTCAISASSLSLVTYTTTDEDDEEYTYTMPTLTTMPLDITISGARAGDTTTVIIERAANFLAQRPDNSELGGFEGETIAIASAPGGDVFSFDLNSLIGRFDDGGVYRIIATVADGLGQSATATTLTLDDSTTTEILEFEVAWDHQPEAPTATLQMSSLECFLTPVAPNSSINYVLTTDTALDDDKTYYTATAVADPDDDDLDTYCEVSNGVYAYTTDTEVDATKTYYTLDAVEEPDVSDIGTYYELTYIDTCDIYRLSADKPQLIYKGATFGEVYVDLYPSIGEFGGYRFVTVSAYDDYITGDGENGDFAWVDYEYKLTSKSNYINFNGRQVALTFDVNLSNTWSKSFKQTTYLGGSVQGDWGKAVTRTTAMQVTVIPAQDDTAMEMLRELAEHPGICHIRTKDGSNFSADVQATEQYVYAEGYKHLEYSLTINRIDDPTMGAVTYSEWREMRDNELAVDIDDTGRLVVTVEEGVSLYSNITLAIDEDTGQLIVTENY